MSSENLLILTPKRFTDLPDSSEQLIASLVQEGFLGKPFEVNDEQHYMPGEEFMMLMTFLGCSPMIVTGELESGGEQYCHIAIEGSFDTPRYMVGDNIKIPRCPKCGHRYDEWQTLLEGWQQQPDETTSCPECGEQSAITSLRWRKCTGFGRFFIKVWGIFESEAVPSPNLLVLLQRCSGVEWHHFYLRYNS